MSLNLGIPTATQSLGQTVNQINANFQFINDGFAINHVEYNGGADTGKHKFLQMPNQGATPTTTATEMSLFTRQSASTATSEMVIVRQNNGTQIEFTAGHLGGNGWSQLPSGVKLVWGTLNTGGAGTFTFNLNAANIPTFPGFSTAVYCVTSNVLSATATTVGRISNFTTAALTIYSNAATNVYFMVLGV